MRSGSLSGHTVRGQSVWRHKHCFTVRNSRRGCPAQGRSRGFLREELCMAEDDGPQRGHGEVDRCEGTRTSTSSRISLMDVSSRPSGKGHNGVGGIVVLEKGFLGSEEHLFEGMSSAYDVGFTKKLEEP
jgi:hypothetical protein